MCVCVCALVCARARVPAQEVECLLIASTDNWHAYMRVCMYVHNALYTGILRRER